MLRYPVVTFEDIRLRKITLSSLDPGLNVPLENNSVLPGVTLRGLPFTVLCRSGRTEQQLAFGIPAG